MSICNILDNSTNIRIQTEQNYPITGWNIKRKNFYIDEGIVNDRKSKNTSFTKPILDYSSQIPDICF